MIQNRNYIIPLVLSSSYLYKYGVLGTKIEKCFNEIYVYIYYDIKEVKNKKLFYYLLNSEKYLYTYYFDKYFTVKLCIDKINSWYIEYIYNSGINSIAKIDLLDTYKKEIPAAKNGSRDFLFFIIIVLNSKYFIFKIFSLII